MNPWLLFWSSAALAMLGAMGNLAQDPDEAASGQGLRRVHVQSRQQSVNTGHTPQPTLALRQQASTTAQ